MWQIERQDVEMALGCPRLPVADDVEATFGAADGDIEQVGLARRPPAGSGAVGGAAQDEYDDVGLLPCAV